MQRILISSCLVGEKVRHDGRDKLNGHPHLIRWQNEGRLVPFCPEIAGGLPIPRPPAEIQGGDGAAVLRGDAVVETNAGNNVTAAFVSGAEQALALAKKEGVTMAVLKAKSPSCGVGMIYDGGFNGTQIPGSGVTATLLEQNGIRVFHENQLDEAGAFFAELNGER
ncbi:DUF523 domain-containing protein [Acanthopleuribacter pedis]|uniref:DUF523 domain-containing protein n=1 Tax=Acanthopleuribacter pedis TaxID=442870 RepID=A0A8J7QC09_9BACT|nr:DUF523 domain-containing protein [Acanthopleuribacter pedis]MBO1320985.1 DUF523 domain-containing protein [Acanthopleuribacter pedis]